MNAEKYETGLGVMSGTSLDGLDLAICSFAKLPAFQIIDFAHIPYSESWREALSTAHDLSAKPFLELEISYTGWMAAEINQFLGSRNSQLDFIACHGHTIFHQPELGLTYQMTNGAQLAALTGQTVVCDFRRMDVALTGQGAPLVPLGDEMLFGQYAACLNLGGFANLSLRSGVNRIAFDICPANMPLNKLMHTFGKEFDDQGQTARSGEVNDELLFKLNALEFYQLGGPKSLGREWYEQNFEPLLTQISPRDALATVVEHISLQIAYSLAKLNATDQVLLTGGGCLNNYLVERLNHHCTPKLKVPEKLLIEAKEALVFALLGKLRCDGKTNVLATVTGAIQDHCGGSLYTHKSNVK